MLNSSSKRDLRVLRPLYRVELSPSRTMESFTEGKRLFLGLVGRAGFAYGMACPSEDIEYDAVLLNGKEPSHADFHVGYRHWKEQLQRGWGIRRARRFDVASSALSQDLQLGGMGGGDASADRSSSAAISP